MKCEKCGKETDEKWKKLCDDCFKKKDMVTMEQAAKEGAELMMHCQSNLSKLGKFDTASLNSVFIQACRRMWPGGRKE